MSERTPAVSVLLPCDLRIGVAVVLPSGAFAFVPLFPPRRVYLQAPRAWWPKGLTEP